MEISGFRDFFGPSTILVGSDSFLSHPRLFGVALVNPYAVTFPCHRSFKKGVDETLKDSLTTLASGL